MENTTIMSKGGYKIYKEHGTYFVLLNNKAVFNGTLIECENWILNQWGEGVDIDL